MPRPDDTAIGSHAIWSGVITFGLVSVPVALLPALRPDRIPLRMVAPDGTPLRRRYYCSKEDRPLEREEIVRGYEFEKDRFVIVSDEELEALAPKRSKEIDLRRFVPVGQIDPAYFDRAYFLSPLGDTVKPYRLLAAAMEASGRAGIATFVMRGKEYLVAILSEKGLLRAETLRFADEIRSPAKIGLAEPQEVPEKIVKEISAALRAAEGDFDPAELENPSTRQLQQLLEDKRASGRGVLQTDPQALELHEEQGKVVDLMELLKRSIGLESADAGNVPKGAADGYADATRSSRQELYERARDLEIPGRSGMSKEELAAAIEKKKRTGPA